MNEPQLSLARARELLSVTPSPAVRARILRAVLAPRPPRARKSIGRTLVVVAALLVSATAAAVVAPPRFARWLGWRSPLESAKRGATPSPPRTRPRDARPVAPHDGPRVVSSSQALVPSPPSVRAPEPPVPTVAPTARSAPPSTAPPAPSTSLLAQEVAAYREAAALVDTSPGLAIVRLRAHREHFPASALGPEVSLRLVQAFTALGRGADARREAQSFLVRYPHNPRRPEMQAIVDGAPLRTPSE